ncbi:MAG: hypothetical protein CMH60_00425 [Myxococcales bacterium]|nr:hypothetical protein [Myxococcales bacterium]
MRFLTLRLYPLQRGACQGAPLAKCGDALRNLMVCPLLAGSGAVIRIQGGFERKATVSYLVLARKYRPPAFADIVGQEHIVQTLENAIKLERVHHAFLFTGPRGVGKTTTARVLASTLGCDELDVVEVDAASNSGVDNVRELCENVRYRPTKGAYKVYIIDEVHMLSQAAFNALLKTLEEPLGTLSLFLLRLSPIKSQRPFFLAVNASIFAAYRRMF